MYVVDNQTMQSIDRETIAAGTPGLELMERAGAGGAEVLLERPDWLDGCTLALCGKGNNGGDALVIARHLHASGHDVQILLTTPARGLSEEASVNLKRALDAGLGAEELGEDPAAALRRWHRDRPGRLLLDGLLGTGFQPPLRGALAELAAAAGTLGRTVVALDCPTGVNGSTGAADERTPVARLTLTFGLPKWGLFLRPARGYCGRIVPVDLGFPSSIVETAVASTPGTALYVDRAVAGGWWRPRAVEAHKYRAGSLVAVGASSGMSGAITLAVLAAYRAGAGLVEAAVPGGQRMVIDGNCTEALIHAMPETDRGGLSPDALDDILALAERRDAVALGPGGGPDLATAGLFLDLIDALESPLVVDADALNAVHRLQRLPHFPSRCVLTPHSGELGRLLGKESREIEEHRREIVAGAARELGVVLLHKGAPTMVAAPDGRLAVLGPGGPGLATAGSGDVLTGVTAAMLAAGHAAFEAACLAAWIHGRAGDIAEEEIGVAPLLARDLVETVAAAVRELEDDQR